LTPGASRNFVQTCTIVMILVSFDSHRHEELARMSYLHFRIFDLKIPPMVFDHFEPLSRLNLVQSS